MGKQKGKGVQRDDRRRCQWKTVLRFLTSRGDGVTDQFESLRTFRREKLNLRSRNSRIRDRYPSFDISICAILEGKFFVRYRCPRRTIDIESMKLSARFETKRALLHRGSRTVRYRGDKKRGPRRAGLSTDEHATRNARN